MMHTMRDGTEIRIEDMEESHLRNVIALHHRKAKEGIKIQRGGGWDADEIWYDEYWIMGREVLQYLETAKYEQEIERREAKRHRTTPRE
jgi:hypothetical protein